MQSLYKLVRAAVMKYHRLGGLNDRYVLSHSFGVWKLGISVLVDWFSGAHSLWLVDSHLLPCSHVSLS